MLVQSSHSPSLPERTTAFVLQIGHVPVFDILTPIIVTKLTSHSQRQARPRSNVALTASYGASNKGLPTFSADQCRSCSVITPAISYLLPAFASQFLLMSRALLIGQPALEWESNPSPINNNLPTISICNGPKLMAMQFLILLLRDSL